MRKPLTGEPCAGELHARFGGRGGPVVLLYPYHLNRARLVDSAIGHRQISGCAIGDREMGEWERRPGAMGRLIGARYRREGAAPTQSLACQ